MVIKEHDLGYADQFGDYLEMALGNGATEIEDIVRALNETDLKPLQGGEWTPDTLVNELRRLSA